MKADLVEPLVDAAKSVLETMAFTPVQAGEPYVKTDALARGDVSAIVGLTGEASGTISVSFTEKSILPIVSNMLGEQFGEMNEDIRDAVGEITNMISGQSRRTLEEKGKLVEAAIPTVIMGKNHSIAHMTRESVMAIPFVTEHGEFTIEVCFEESSRSSKEK
jgi:chemotaxis protein CheX